MKTINSIVKERILPNFRGFEYNKNILFKTPLEDVLAGFYFEKTSSYTYVWVFFQPLIIPSSNIYFSFGERLRDSQNRAIFKLDEANIDNSIQEIIKAISSKISYVEKYKEIESFYEKFAPTASNLAIFENIVYINCYLDKPQCLDGINQLIERIETASNKQLDWMQDILRRAKELRGTVNMGAVEKTNLFKKWKYSTLKNLSLSKWSSEKTV